MAKKKDSKKMIDVLEARLKKNIKHYYLSDQKSLLIAYDIGIDCNIAKDHSKKNNIKWEDFATRMAPHLHKRRRQRCMKLAKSIKKKDVKILSFLSQNTIFQLASIAPNKNIVHFLKSKCINIEKAPQSPNKIWKLTNDIKNLIEKHKKDKNASSSQKSSKSETKNPKLNETLSKVNRWLEKTVKKNKTPKKTTVKELRKIRDLVDKILAQIKSEPH